MLGQVGLGDVALWGGVLAPLCVPAAGGLGQADVALQDLGGQRGAALTSVSWRGDAPRVSHQGAVGKEGPRLWRNWGELPTTSSWGAGVGHGRDGAFAQGTCALYSGRDMACEHGLGMVPNHARREPCVSEFWRAGLAELDKAHPLRDDRSVRTQCHLDWGMATLNVIFWESC